MVGLTVKTINTKVIVNVSGEHLGLTVAEHFEDVSLMLSLNIFASGMIHSGVFERTISFSVFVGNYGEK